MGTRDPRVDAYLEKAQPFAKPILRHLRRVVHAACPGVREEMKWNFPHFDYKGVFCGMAAFKAHCTFGFWKAELLDGLGNRAKEAQGQMGRITSIEDLPPETELTRLIKQAAKLNDAGVKVKRVPRGPKAPLAVPAELSGSLKKNRKAQAAFDAFSPSHRRIRRVDHRGEAGRHPSAPDRPGGRVDGRRQIAKLEIRIVLSTEH